MRFQIALWILIMEINFSLNKESNRPCYQAEKELKTDEFPTKIRAKRSLSRIGRGLKPKQSGLCSTWGNFHFKTFDGEIYRFPGICNYLFAAHCGKHFEDFNIQIQQSLVNNLPVIAQISVKLNELLIEIIDHNPTVHGLQLKLPYSKNGIRIEKFGATLKIYVKLGLELTLDDNNSIHLILNKKYMGEACGLCGDYNGDPSNDLVYEGNLLEPLQFGKLHKLRKPEQICEDPEPEATERCIIYKRMCLQQLKNSKWTMCNRLVKTDPYVDAYMLDMCLCNATEKYSAFCLCTTIAEYSRQCAVAGGRPPEWRSQTMCYKPCPLNLIYNECSPPCAPTCSNPGRHFFCDGPCVAGCTCPKGYVLDDITNLGCIVMKNCSCTYNNQIYPPGSVYNGTCHTCLCSGGHWNCQELPCPSVCSVEGGSHITTFDKAHYTFHGKCSYVLTKPCADNKFSVTIEMKKCAYSETATCLTQIVLFLDKGKYMFDIKYDNNDFPQVTYDKQTMAKAGVTICWPSSFYLVVYTNKGLYLQVQLTPIMQLYVILDPSYKEKMCGLCGNFNSIQKDDFRTNSGALESNVVDFANTWKTQYQCKNIKQVHEHPCIYGMEIEKYAHYWCNVLIDTKGPFAACHASLSPGLFHQNCLFDTCSCKRAEDCLCAAISSYVWACAAVGIMLSGWRETICRNFLSYCPPPFVYSYTVTTCIPTCRSLSEPDPTCCIKFYTVDGCVCPNGTYLDDKGFCVKKEDCPCYYKGVPVSANKPLHVSRLICTCIKGTLNCTDQGKPECPPPMIYFDCENAETNANGTQCPQTCHTSKAQCYSPQCVSGCVCPEGLHLSENITCIREEECPCTHNGMSYKPGEIATIHCDECICRNRSWVCDSKEEKGICTVYGEGNFITFDNKRYTMNGDCEYTLVQDYCDIDDLRNGTFKVISENIPCGTTGTSCSKSITVYVGDHKLILTDGHLEVLERSSDVEIPYKSKHMGSFLVIEMVNGIVLVWDRMTSIYIHLSTDFKGKVCGLCGNFDGNGNNDFTKRSQCVVEDVKEFRDSWKLSPECSDVYISKDPCVVNPYRMAWAQKLCNIILSDEFASCHKEVDPEIYYDACVRDTCACDVGGDCDCYCTAISAYAQACSEACVCIEWRSPSVCPLFCGFYNKEGECQWHYKPCGDPCMKTCSNPNGTCIYDLKGLEGCYPSCPDDKPYFNEDKMQCVAQCGCLDKEDNFYALGEEVESCNICESCICTITGILCHDDINACKCVYRGKSIKFGESIVVDEDLGNCTIVKCGLNGTMEYPCYGNPEITEVSTTALTTTTEQLVILTTPAKSSSRPTMSSVITTISSESTEITTGLESSSVVSETVSTLLTGTSEETFISDTNSPKSGITEPIYTQRNDISYYNVLNESTFMTTTESPEKTPFSTISPGISTAISTPIALTAPYHIVSTTTLSSPVTKKNIKWPVECPKCVNLTCYEDGTSESNEIQCQVQNVTCDSEKPPLKIYDPHGCCFHYECAHCIGPSGVKKNPGETWIDNCQVCICDEDLVTVSCSRMKCPPLNYPLCDKPWLQPYTLQDEENQCCSKIECRCEPSKCQYLAESCPLGHEAIPTISEGECCVTFNCRPMNVCIVNGNVYQIGQTIWEERSLCKECSCSEIKDSKTGFNTVICDPILCRIECPQGYDYEKSNNDCCGKCVQVSCALTAADGSIYLLEPGKSQFLPDDNCTTYTCALIGENLVTSSLTHICPNLHDEECDSDQLVKDPDGCCNICQAPKTCRVGTNVTEITQKGCSANVTLSYCEGSCPSLTMFSDKSLKIERMCGCCLETETTNIEIELFCPGDTSNIKAFITSVKNCACTIANCIP